MKKKFDKAKQSASRLMVKLKPRSRSRSHSPNAPEPDPGTMAPGTSSGGHRYADPQSPQTALATTGSVIQEVLATTRDASDMFLPLKAALVGAVKIFEICQRTAEIREQYKNLESRLVHLGALTGALSKRPHIDPNLKQRLDEIAESFSRLTACIEEKQARGTTRRVLESQADIGEVKDILLKISTRIEAFMYESMVRVEIGVDAILARLPTTEEKIFQKELEEWRVITEVIRTTLGGRRVHDAAYDSQASDAGCMPGTRVGVLSKFVEWVKNDPKSIFWLAGMAGTGKTSIAVSLSRMLHEDPEVVLAGTFFCSRTSGDEARVDVRRILPTLAALLADHSPIFAAELAAELKPSSGAAAHKPVSEQIGPLLQRPLAALSSETRPIVYVIDALDECSNERELSELLKAISTFTRHSDIKFILTSRPETHILGTPISDKGRNEILQLHLIEPEDVTEDIRLYIDHTFSQSKLAGPDAWYSDGDVRALAALSNGLFIFASTTLTYILDTETADDRTSRLHTALSASKDSEVITGPLDDMYEFVLTRASSKAKVEPRELAKTQQVLACILTIRMPLSVNALSQLLGHKPDVLRASLRRLRAVVHVPDEFDQPGLRTLHASFGDYLLERAAPGLRITRSLGNDALARGCLQLMATKLHFNISQSHSSYKPNPSERPESVTLALEYACLQWAHHVYDLPDSSALNVVIKDHLVPRFLFWLEVMSVLGQVRRASAMLILVAATIQSTRLSRFLRDAISFVATSRGAIERSAPHIYISALPFAGNDSLIYRAFSPMCTGVVSLTATYGIDRPGGQLVMSLIGHENGVLSIAYSPDGLLIASGSGDGSVRIWNTRTYEEAMSPLRSGDGGVYSVAFAPSGEIIASGTRLSAHSRPISSVTFSADGSLLAAASKDDTVSLWSVKTGNLRVVLSGHTEVVRVALFSPDGQMVASASDDTSIRLWHVATGQPAEQLLLGHTRAVYDLSFSPDGKILASCSGDQTIRLWDVQGYVIVHTLFHTDSLISVRFAPSGQQLVSTLDDHSIRLWDLPYRPSQSRSIVLGYHTSSFTSAIFSPDGLYIASGLSDGSVLIWDSGNGHTTTQPLPCHDNSVSSVTTTSNGVTIISGSQDASVRIWNAHTGEPMLPPLMRHTSHVSSVAISSDGTLIASGSGDNAILLWDGRTGETVGPPLAGCKAPVLTVKFSRNMRWIASGHIDRTVCIWEVATRQLSKIGLLHCHEVVIDVAFSPDSRIVAAGDGHGNIFLWYAETGQSACDPFQAHSVAVTAIDFSPDGMRLASGGNDSTIHIWDIRTRQKILVLEGHDLEVSSLAYSLDNRFIVSGSEDTTTRLWNAETGELLATLYGHGDAVYSVAFASDGRSIVSGSQDHTIRVWDVGTALSMRSKGSGDLTKALVSTTLVNGWLLGPSDELLLWVPVDYRRYLQVEPCSMIIGPRRILIAADAGSLHRGESWMSCWNSDVSTLRLRED